jgi:hypothetical protein
MAGPYHPLPMVPELFRPSFALPLIVMVGALLAATGLYAWGLLLRIADRPVPRWAGLTTAFLFGLPSSIAVLGLATTDAALDALLVLASVFLIPIVLASARRFDLSGWMLLGAGLLPLLWWGFFVVQDLVTEPFDYDDPVGLWLLQALAVIILGLIGVAMGDRRVTPARPPPDQPDPTRAISIFHAMRRELQYGPVDVPNATAFSVGGVAAIAAWTGATALGVGDFPSAAIAVLVLALVSTEVFYHAWPRRLARALATHAFVGSWEVKRFRATTGTRPPTSARAARAWLEQNPETDANRWSRVELLGWTGQLEEARAVVDRLPDGTEAERFERLDLEVLLDIVAGREADVEGLASAAERIGEPGSDERLRAVASAALAESRRRLAYGDDAWKEPLLEAYGRIGARSLGITRADTWVQRFLVVAGMGAAIVAFGWLLPFTSL